jgi:hypothetical protein
MALAAVDPSMPLRADGSNNWSVHRFDRMGRWTSSAIGLSKDAAIKRAARMRRREREEMTNGPTAQEAWGVWTDAYGHDHDGDEPRPSPLHRLEQLMFVLETVERLVAREHCRDAGLLPLVRGAASEAATLLEIAESTGLGPRGGSGAW